MPDVQGVGSRWRQGKPPGRHLAIGQRRIEHRHLIKRRREAKAWTGSEEEDVVLMPVRIADERAERVKPSKAASVFLRQSPGVHQ